MSVFTKKNALVGFLTLKALERRRRRHRRKNALKIGTFLVLGILSVGLLAGLALVLRRRQQAESRLEVVEDAVEREAADEAYPASTEPVPAA